MTAAELVAAPASRPTPPITVFIADDQELFRDGMRMLIDSQPDLRVVGCAADGHEAVRLVAELHPELVLMDIRMPGLDGLAATRLLMTEPHPPRVIVVTTFRQDEAVIRAVEAGASGFVTKDTKPELLLEAIRAVHAGNSVLVPAATFDLLARFSSRSAAPDASVIAALSPREVEIFLLAAKGLSNAEIAESAFIEESTVKSHMVSILAKLALRSRAQLIAFAWSNRLVS